MKNRIFNILSGVGIKDAACCSFSCVEKKLLECRAKMRLPKNSKTVIMCAFPYKVKDKKPQYISRYAAVPDYHYAAGNYLLKAVEILRKEFPQNKFEYFMDNSPVPEVFAAATAGLGVKGDNNLLITKEYGSWVFLGEIVTDIEIECQDRYSECIHCGACKKMCPEAKESTGCLSEISQKKKELSENEIHSLQKYGIIWGCDICAECCPLNKGVKIAPLPEFKDGYRDSFTKGEDISGRAYAWRGEKVVNRNYSLLFEKEEKK